MPKTTKKAVAKKKAPKKAPVVKVELVTNGVSYKAEGKTTFDALDNLGLNYTQLKAKAEVFATKGKVTVKRLLYLRQLKPVFANKTRRAGLAKQLDTLFEYGGK